jgi:hypothetical protein
VRRKDDRLVRANDGIDVLEEDNPRQHGMREASLLGFVMMLAKVAGSVKKLLRDNRSFDANVSALVENRLVVHADGRFLRGDIVEGSPSGVKTAISAVEQQTHVRRAASVAAEPIGSIAFFVSKEQLIRSIQVNNATIRRKRANALARGLGQKCDKSHEIPGGDVENG